MAEPRKVDEGHVALTSRQFAITPTTPIVVPAPLLASGGPPPPAPAGVTTGNGYINSHGTMASEPYRLSTQLPRMHEIKRMPPVAGYNVPRNDDVITAYMQDVLHRSDDNNPRPGGAKENATPTSEELFAKVTKKLEEAVPKRYGKSTQVPTIYKVPDELKGGVGDHKDYCPVAVYLGGFDVRPQYDRSWFNLEEYKWCCVRQLIDRHGIDVDSIEARKLLQSCLKRIDELLSKVLASYSQYIEVVDNNEMTERMLLDGCLILHRLLRNSWSHVVDNGGNERKNDDWTRTFGRCWVWQSVSRDMLLLENQIPFFVVKELFKLLKKEGESEELLFTGSRGLFHSLRLPMDLSHIERNNVHHLLHLFYLSVGLPHDEKGPNRSYRDEVDVFLPDLTQWVPSARELEEAGVSFRKKKEKKKEENATSFLDISFDPRKGILEIPPLQLHDSSSALFRNLIAFEQTYPATRCNVSAYTAFMDCLIKTPEDMRILHLRGILVNQMNGEQDANRFFSQICAGVHFPADNYLVDLMQKVSKYKESRRHGWRAALMQNHFRNPWMAMSVFAAVLLLALTVLQTFFTVYPYYKPSRRG